MDPLLGVISPLTWGHMPKQGDLLISILFRFDLSGHGGHGPVSSIQISLYAEIFGLLRLKASE
jgi:hypothetical protein